jgi:hypothetical protein
MIQPNNIRYRPYRGLNARVRMPTHGLRRGLIAIAPAGACVLDGSHGLRRGLIAIAPAGACVLWLPFRLFRGEGL